MTKTTETTTALSMKGITSGYGTTTIVRNIDLNIKAGSVTALFGPNGVGKSTLLKTMSGLIRPMSGSVMIDGHDVSSLAPKLCEERAFGNGVRCFKWAAVRN